MDQFFGIIFSAYFSNGRLMLFFNTWTEDRICLGISTSWKCTIDNKFEVWKLSVIVVDCGGLEYVMQVNMDNTGRFAKIVNT